MVSKTKAFEAEQGEASQVLLDYRRNDCRINSDPGADFAKNGQPIIQPAWASVALGIAAALVLLDRFFGYSSAWMRYIATELNIRQLTQELQLDWEADKATWLGSEPTPDQLRSTLARFKAFVTQVEYYR